jgi:hypothetical protein
VLLRDAAGFATSRAMSRVPSCVMRGTLRAGVPPQWFRPCRHPAGPRPKASPSGAARPRTRPPARMAKPASPRGRRVDGGNRALQGGRHGVGDRGADGRAEVVGHVGEAAAGQRRLEARLQDEPVVAQRRQDVAEPPLLVRGQVDRIDLRMWAGMWASMVSDRLLSYFKHLCRMLMETRWG